VAAQRLAQTIVDWFHGPLESVRCTVQPQMDGDWLLNRRVVDVVALLLVICV
jgi:hypothetical protein